jgi:GT2 family glycosyltransferase
MGHGAMNTNPLVSVVIPVYKGANYVADAIESVLAQTYQNIEIIVVDDGSPDDGATRRAVEKFIPRVRYIHQENQGVAGALNTGWQAMRGEIFSWLSHDDLFVPDKTEKQIAFRNMIGRDDAVIYSDYMNVDPDNQRLYDVVMDHDMLTRQPLLAILRGCTNGCTMLIPKKVFEVVGGFDTSLRHTQDYDFWDRIETHFPLVHCPGIVVRQRLHPAQDSAHPAAIDECNRLWLRLADNRDHNKRSIIAGSSLQFLRGMRDFVAQTPYSEALSGLQDRIDTVVASTLVTVIVDVPGEVPPTESIAAMFATQSHKKIELILVQRGGAERAPETGALADPVVSIETLVAPGASRADGFNQAITMAKGDYLVFLNTGNILTPRRIELQMAAMQDKGALISHSSFYVSCPTISSGFKFAPSGMFQGGSGRQLIPCCPIRLETAMFNSLVFAKGLRFKGDLPADEVLFFIDAAKSNKILGLQEAMTILTLSAAAAPVNLAESLSSLAKLRVGVDTDPALESFLAERAELGARYEHLAALLRAAVRNGQAPNQALNPEIIQFLMDPQPDAQIDHHGFLEPHRTKSNDRDKRFG